MAKKVKTFHIKFNLRNKMPVSLNPYESQLDEASQRNATSVIKRRLKTTNKMVEEALIELHTARGVSLRQIYSFILANYNLESLTKTRVFLIKKHILSLRESKDIINTTGKGFSGKFKLVDKSKFVKKVTINIKKSTTKRVAPKTKNTYNESETNPPTAVLKSKTTIKRNVKKLSKSAKQILPVIPRQVTPVALRHNNISMFDTPMVASQVHASTPFISTGFVPRAPEVNQRINRKRIEQEDYGTPRSSLPGKKRRLLHRPQ